MALEEGHGEADVEKSASSFHSLKFFSFGHFDFGFP
jgi:hypothetical protein